MSMRPSLVTLTSTKAFIELSVYVEVEVAFTSSLVFLSSVPDAGEMVSIWIRDLLLPIAQNEIHQNKDVFGIVLLPYRIKQSGI